MPLTPSLVELLCCPHDHGALAEAAGDLRCETCGTVYPVRDGVVVFLSSDQLSDREERERALRDEESSWYDQMFEGYTNAVEVPTTVARVGAPEGPVLDAGCGTGRITKQLLALGNPVVAVDYSEVCLRRMLERCAGEPVVAVQADLRRLPVRTGAIHGATCIEAYPHVGRAHARRAFLDELARVMVPGSSLSVSAYNFNLMFRAWERLGNQGAREGEHMLGGEYYYRRFRPEEFRAELAQVFDVVELTGIRNIPARTLAEAVRRTGLRRAGDRLLEYMNVRGHRADIWLERTPVAPLVGFFLLARAVRRPAANTPLT